MKNSSPLHHPAYRPDIDGLRAVAVLAVLGFHAFPAMVRGGYVGVDIFFVISGFLITTIIAGSLQRGTFTFRGFYERRVKRIFPALILILAASVGFGALILLADEFQQLGKHVAGAAIFVTNFILLGEAGYFDASADTKPLLHLWSLAVEEQFYLLWPFMVWCAWRFRVNLLAATLVVAIASFGYNVWSTGANQVAAFYTPFARFWELMAGGALAVMATRPRESRVRTFDQLKSAFGCVVLGAAILLLAKRETFPGWWALLPTLGAVLVINAGPDAFINRFILSNRLVVWVGLISYPLYLWHWILLSFARITYGTVPSASVRLMALALSMVLAWATYRFIESRCRGSKSKPLYAALLASMAALLALGLAINWKFGALIKGQQVAFAEFVNAKKDWDYPEATFNGQRIKVVTLPGRSTDVALFYGDSHMSQYFPAVRAQYQNPGALPYFTSVFASHNHCTPSPHTRQTTSDSEITQVKCDELYKHFFQLAMQPAVKTVVFGGHWRIDKYYYTRDSLRYFGEDVARLTKLGKRVVVILNVPEGADFSPDFILRRARLGSLFSDAEVDLGEPQYVDRAAAAAVTAPSMRMVKDIVEKSGAETIDPYDYLCDANRCPVLLNGRPVYSDAHHLRPYYVIERATFFRPLLGEPAAATDPVSH
jgi:peptidoglycan/LPS O-acetylase OafA/YrhL